MNEFELNHEFQTEMKTAKPKPLFSLCSFDALFHIKQAIKDMRNDFNVVL